MSPSTSGELHNLDFMISRDEKADSYNHVVVKDCKIIRLLLFICGYNKAAWVQNSVRGTYSSRS